MKKGGRYKTSHLVEDQYEPGSKDLVLKNLLRIKTKREIDRIETIALKQAEDKIFKTYDQNHGFTSADLCKMHKIWLGGIYEWAGRYRQVNVSKVELILIHPFREGNGRIARLLVTLMALQAGLPLLDFNPIIGKKRREYFAAVQAGLDRNYVPMENVFEGIIRQTLSRH